MPPSSSDLRFDKSFDAETGNLVRIAPGIERVTAPNASAFTFTGTNTFLVGGAELAIIDPGPDSEVHLAALLRAIGGRRVKAIVLTHTHRDHSALAPKLAAALGAPLWFAGRHRLSRPLKPFEFNPFSRSCDWDLVPDKTIADGQILSFGTVQLQAMTTPGHCANHMAFGVMGTPMILCGDHVMGWSSTLVAVPDGSMADYFASLDKIIGSEWTHYLPAHGGSIPHGRQFARALKVHREIRNGQILEALSAGGRTLGQLRAAIYPGLPKANLIAAGMTLKAHLEYLAADGRVTSQLWPFGRRYFLTTP